MRILRVLRGSLRDGRARADVTTAVGLALIASASIGACIAVAPRGIHRETDQGSGGGSGGSPFTVDGGPPDNLPPDAGSSDPHAVVGVDPSHGPFTGGQRVLVRGKGFTSKARVFFGATEVDETTALPVDPTRVQVVAPPGVAGAVDVSVQNGDDTSTRRSLPGGYVYDALYATPNSGPVPGGTIVTITGQGTSWDATTIARIDNKPCTTLTVDTPTQLTCGVPAGTPGSKTISVSTGTETITVLDAYTYEDSVDGFKGGLSGPPLAGQLKVLVYDNFTGDPVPGALVLAGSDITTAIKGMSDATGVTLLTDPSLNGPTTVTIAGICHSPITFVAEPVSTVTAYLDPVLSPACGASGDPPPVGGKVASLGQVQGELVWPTTGEFKKGDWSNVPNPIGSSEHLAAYVFIAQSDPTTSFALPSPATAVLPTTPGDRGPGFSVAWYPGSHSFYALAGIEDDTKSPPSFTAYAMGSVTGVPLFPGEVTSSVFISMTKTLDQELTMAVEPPAPGPKGPDRLRANVAVRIGPDGYAIFPAGQKSPYLPVQGTLGFVGLPALDGDLAGAVYVSSARAVTGSSATAPMSIIASVTSTTTSQPLDMSGFVNVPQLTTPQSSAAWDGMHLATTFAAGGAPIDLTVYDVASGDGLMHWTIAAPGGSGSQAIAVPSLAGFPQFTLPPGPINIAVYGARIDGFDYSKLTYRQLRTQGMSAYSLDYFDAHL